jgi:hypothetical protein
MKKLIAVIIFSLCFLNIFAQNNIPNYLPTNGLVGWWPFKGNANDESGNGNHGTVNGALLTVDRFGHNASSYFFDGLSNFIEVPHSSSITVQNGITISCWFKADNSSTGSTQTLISKGVQSAFWNYGISLNNNGVACYNYTGYGVGSLNVMNSQTWHHVLFSIDINANSMYEYIDGVIQPTLYNINSNAILTDFQYLINSCCTAKLTFGKNSGGQAFFKGSIDEIAIYNRMLSQQEITTLYQGTSTQTGSVGINTRTPNPSAALDISDTERGLLIPRMTALQRNNINNPADALMIFQTDDSTGFWFYSDHKWNMINTKGTKGDQGFNGANGLNALIKTSIELPGINCSTGGTKIEIGLDSNINGILDTNEVNGTHTKYVCNGANDSLSHNSQSNLNVLTIPTNSGVNYQSLTLNADNEIWEYSLNHNNACCSGGTTSSLFINFSFVDQFNNALPTNSYYINGTNIPFQSNGVISGQSVWNSYWFSTGTIRWNLPAGSKVKLKLISTTDGYNGSNPQTSWTSSIVK